MPWQAEEMKPGDRVAQAGVALVEQALFADGGTFPDSLSGLIKLPDRNGRVELNLPGVEFVNSQRQHDSDGSLLNTKVYHENIDTITDAKGQKVQTVDEQAQGFLLDINASNKYAWCRKIVRDGKGDLQYQLQGNCSATTMNGVFKDASFLIYDHTGRQLPVQIHIVGQATGVDSLKISASTIYADQAGVPIPDSTGRPQVLGVVEANITVDPNKPTGAKIELKRAGRTLDSL